MIVKEAAEIDRECKVSPKAISILNDAASSSITIPVVKDNK